MAGDWIKMRADLQTHPKVVRILSATMSDKFRVLGGLHAVWSIFDVHSDDGMLNGYTPDVLDHVIGWQGFCQAMIDVNWMAYDGLQTLTLPEFGEHNGQSAKRRAEDQKRKRNSRSIRPEVVRTNTGQKEDDLRTREEDIDQDQEQHTQRAGYVGDIPEKLNVELNGHDLLGDAPSPAKPKRQSCPTKAILDLYHEILCPPLPVMEKLTPKREGQIRARWQEDLPELEHWRNFFGYVKTVDYLMGRKPGTNGRKPFRADIEFMTNATYFARIAEGKYE